MAKETVEVKKAVDTETVTLSFTGSDRDVLAKLRKAADDDDRSVNLFIVRYLRGFEQA